MKIIIDFIKENPREAIEDILAWSSLMFIGFMLFVIGG